jgi:hypothetical protein
LQQQQDNTAKENTNTNTIVSSNGTNNLNSASKKQRELKRAKELSE